MKSHAAVSQINNLGNVRIAVTNCHEILEIRLDLLSAHEKKLIVEKKSFVDFALMKYL